MNHVAYEKWLQYVRDELDEKERGHCEDHLYECDQCLPLYLEAVEAVELDFSIITTDKIMHEISKRQVLKQEVKMNEQSFYKKTILHYTVAAAMTLLLMSSGIFSQLIDVVGDFESVDENKSSIISGIMDTSISIIDKVEIKEGNKHD